MPKNNLKPKNLSKKPLQKKKVSFGILSVEKNTKSETLVIAREQSDRNNLRDVSGLLRFARNDKGASGNDKGVSGNDKSVGAWNFKSWHKISVAVLSLGIIAVVVFFQFLPQNARSKTFTFFQTARNTVVRGLDRACGFALRLSAGFLYSA